MPTIAIPLGLLGIVPFVFFGLRAVGPDAGSALRMLVGLIDYAALILTFAGGVHWGMALSPMASRPAARMGGGAVPLVIAWVGLILVQIVGQPLLALVVLCIGYLAAIVVEHRAARMWLMPVAYVWLRWGITLVALVMMIGVIVLRSVGQTIVF